MMVGYFFDPVISEAVVALNLTTSGKGTFTPNMKNPVSYIFRAMAEELADIRGGVPVASNKSDHDLAIHRSLEEKGLKRYKNKVGHCFRKKEKCFSRV